MTMNKPKTLINARYWFNHVDDHIQRSITRDLKTIHVVRSLWVTLVAQLWRNVYYIHRENL